MNLALTQCLSLLDISLDTREHIFSLIPYRHKIVIPPPAEEQAKALLPSLLGPYSVGSSSSACISTSDFYSSLISQPLTFESASERGSKPKNPPSQCSTTLLWTQPNFLFSFPTNGEIIYTCCLFSPLIQSPNHCNHLFGNTAFH